MKYRTLTEAAAALELSSSTLRHQIANGALRAEKVGPLWMVTDREIERYRAVSRGQTGPRPKARPAQKTGTQVGR